MEKLSDKIDKGIRFNLGARVHYNKHTKPAADHEKSIRDAWERPTQENMTIAYNTGPAAEPVTICPLDFFIEHADAYIFHNAKNARTDCYFQGVVDVGMVAHTLRAKRKSVQHVCLCGNHLRGALAKKIRSSRNDMDDAWLFVLKLVRQMIKENSKIIARSRMSAERHNVFTFMQYKIYKMREANLSKDL